MPQVEVALIVSNNASAGVLELAEQFKIRSLVISRAEFYDSGNLDEQLQKLGIDLIVLAGFLWLIPPRLIEKFPGRIINIHPALLPKYGGKGMYGHHVHEAVKASGDQLSGITIHYVDERYDHGLPIFQCTCPLDTTDTPGMIAAKVLKLEHLHYPLVIEKLLLDQEE